MTDAIRILGELTPSKWLKTPPYLIAKPLLDVAAGGLIHSMIVQQQNKDASALRETLRVAGEIAAQWRDAAPLLVPAMATAKIWLNDHSELRTDYQTFQDRCGRLQQAIESSANVRELKRHFARASGLGWDLPRELKARYTRAVEARSATRRGHSRLLDAAASVGEACRNWIFRGGHRPAERRDRQVDQNASSGKAPLVPSPGTPGEG